MRNGTIALDVTDARILRELASDARIATSELARRIGLSAPSVGDRIRRLEEIKVISAYRAVVMPAAIGLPISAYVRITPLPGAFDTVADIVRESPEIVECDRVTGDDSYIAKAHLRSMAHLEDLVDRLGGHAQTHTSIVQSTPVSRRLPPLPGPED
ncbi:Lrp/AsnC family transcriptional regulator [Acuticoccus sp. MNP-M23]|uniref:Lrp/AsnC family transcriptional regulator n=1 Tax=Acuticoccus sp. MNP-M23 TaxID=3072793 RepID=UPI002815A99C|nr:Lrp/AsnC family transcriptional regulator [Acuticoccus sp. MNP-M23]WMS41103.1 Lrp/AsnC family transcriptional regulator [Acuticoccus sp. MNP-M23]